MIQRTLPRKPGIGSAWAPPMGLPMPGTPRESALPAFGDASGWSCEAGNPSHHSTMTPEPDSTRLDPIARYAEPAFFAAIEYATVARQLSVDEGRPVSVAAVKIIERRALQKIRVMLNERGIRKTEDICP